MKKPSVLLISGWAHGTQAMHPLAEAMAESYRVTSLSLAGPGVPATNVRDRLRGGNQGKTDDHQRGTGDGAASISPYARAIALHLDKSAGPSCIVGWSTGGIAAIETAANYPEKVVRPGAFERNSTVLLRHRDIRRASTLPFCGR